MSDRPKRRRSMGDGALAQSDAATDAGRGKRGRESDVVGGEEKRGIMWLFFKAVLPNRYSDLFPGTRLIRYDAVVHESGVWT